MERMKEVAKTQNIGVPMIPEGEMLALKSSGESVDEIARIVPEYDEVKSTVWRRWNVQGMP